MNINLNKKGMRNALPFNSTIKKLFVATLMVTAISFSAQAQEVQRPQPKFLFGAAGAANFNFYSGTTQTLNSEVIVPSAFHEGFGVKPYIAGLIEFRPHPVWGFMLHAGYDNRGGDFNEVMAPCDCPANLKVNLSYLTVEPSLRIAPFASPFYMFVGGAYSKNLNSSFVYEQELQPTREGEFNDVSQNVFSAQIGAGYDIPLSPITNRTQVFLAPFISYHPYFGQEPRTVESWSLQTVRAGVALKFGRARAVVAETPRAAAVEPNVSFTVQTPAVVPVKRKINESFPLRNYVFFEENSSEIPSRYVRLNQSQAGSFDEALLQEPAPTSIAGRSQRQLTAYYNILNILGDRMRDNPGANITLIGSSAGNGAELGKTYAESVKKYLVDVFGISPSRINVEGRNMPVIPSEQIGGTRELEALREGDRRVDIISTSPDLLTPLRIIIVQDDPIESRVIFNTASDDNDPVKSWTLAVSDQNGNTNNYGPFTSDMEVISGNTILGNSNSGRYNVVMVAQTQSGATSRKESSFNLTRLEEPKKEALRFSILFDFDKSKSVAAYEKFITDVVAPNVPSNSTVIIQGYSDNIGEEAHNKTLSDSRARDVHTILSRTTNSSGKTGISYQVNGFGEDPKTSPFENKRPEERFYNRTVIIDIIPGE